MEKLRKHIKSGYKTYNGAVLTCQLSIDHYNRLQDEINAWIKVGREVPQHLLNESHRHFVIMCDVAKK